MKTQQAGGVAKGLRRGVAAVLSTAALTGRAGVAVGMVDDLVSSLHFFPFITRTIRDSFFRMETDPNP